MTFGITVALWMILVMSAVLDAANTAQTTTLGTTNQDRLNEILENEPVDVRQIGIAGQNAAIPFINPSFLSSTFAFLTWDRSYFKQDWNMLRWIFTAITFAFTLFAIKELADPLVNIARFIGETMANIVGGFASVARSLLFR